MSRVKATRLLRRVAPEIAFHDISEEVVTVDNQSLLIRVEADTVDGGRAAVQFDCYQAMRVISEDFHAEIAPKATTKGIYEISPSPWIEELRQASETTSGRKDEVLHQSHHYVLTFFCTVVEIVAFGFRRVEPGSPRVR